jgi:hypothetical protein
MTMKFGLLWYDDNPKRPLAEKVDEASQRYYQKFGRRPDTCYVNPASVPAEHGGRNGVKILGASTIPLHHLWLGVEAK